MYFNEQSFLILQNGFPFDKKFVHQKNGSGKLRAASENSEFNFLSRLKIYFLSEMTEANRENNAVGILRKIEPNFETASKSAGEL